MAAGVPYQGAGGRTLDNLDDRLFQAQIPRRNNITGITTLWKSHNIQVTAAEPHRIAARARQPSRWYQIQKSNGHALRNQSVHNVRLSHQQTQIAIGFQARPCRVGTCGNRFEFGWPSSFSEIWAAGRLRTDTSGTTQAPTPSSIESTASNLNAGQTALGRLFKNQC